MPLSDQDREIHFTTMIARFVAIKLQQEKLGNEKLSPEKLREIAQLSVQDLDNKKDTITRQDPSLEINPRSREKAEQDLQMLFSRLEINSKKDEKAKAIFETDNQADFEEKLKNYIDVHYKNNKDMKAILDNNARLFDRFQQFKRKIEPSSLDYPLFQLYNCLIQTIDNAPVVNSCPELMDALEMFQRLHGEYLSLDPLSVDNPETIFSTLTDYALLEPLFLQHLSIKRQANGNYALKFDHNAAKLAWINWEKARPFRQTHSSKAEDVGLREKLLAGKLKKGIWLTDEDLNRGLQALGLRESVSVLQLTKPEDIGLLVHWAREKHQHDDPKERYTVSLILNVGSAENTRLNDTGSHWVHLAIDINPTKEPVSIKARYTDSLFLDPEREKQIRHTIRTALAYEEKNGNPGHDNYRVYQAFPAVEVKDEHISVNGNKTQRDSFTCGYRALQQALRISGLGLNRERGHLLQCESADQFEESVYTLLLSQANFTQDEHDLLAEEQKALFEQKGDVWKISSENARALCQVLSQSKTKKTSAKVTQAEIEQQKEAIKADETLSKEPLVEAANQYQINNPVFEIDLSAVISHANSMALFKKVIERVNLNESIKTLKIESAHQIKLTADQQKLLETALDCLQSRVKIEIKNADEDEDTFLTRYVDALNLRNDLIRHNVLHPLSLSEREVIFKNIDEFDDKTKEVYKKSAKNEAQEKIKKQEPLVIGENGSVLTEDEFIAQKTQEKLKLRLESENTTRTRKNAGIAAEEEKALGKQAKRERLEPLLNPWDHLFSFLLLTVPDKPTDTLVFFEGARKNLGKIGLTKLFDYFNDQENALRLSPLPYTSLDLSGGEGCDMAFVTERLSTQFAYFPFSGLRLSLINEPSLTSETLFSLLMTLQKHGVGRLSLAVDAHQLTPPLLEELTQKIQNEKTLGILFSLEVTQPAFFGSEMQRALNQLNNQVVKKKRDYNIGKRREEMGEVASLDLPPTNTLGSLGQAIKGNVDTSRLACSIQQQQQKQQQQMQQQQMQTSAQAAELSDQDTLPEEHFPAFSDDEELVDALTIEKKLGDFIKSQGILFAPQHCWRLMTGGANLRNFEFGVVVADEFKYGIDAMTLSAARFLIKHLKDVQYGLTMDNLPQGFYLEQGDEKDYTYSHFYNGSVKKRTVILCYDPLRPRHNPNQSPLTLTFSSAMLPAAWSGDITQFISDDNKTRALSKQYKHDIDPQVSTPPAFFDIQKSDENLKRKTKDLHQELLNQVQTARSKSPEAQQQQQKIINEINAQFESGRAWNKQQIDNIINRSANRKLKKTALAISSKIDTLHKNHQQFYKGLLEAMVHGLDSEKADNIIGKLNSVFDRDSPLNNQNIAALAEILYAEGIVGLNQLLVELNTLKSKIGATAFLHFKENFIDPSLNLRELLDKRAIIAMQTLAGLKPDQRLWWETLSMQHRSNSILKQAKSKPANGFIIKDYQNLSVDKSRWASLPDLMEGFSHFCEKLNELSPNIDMGTCPLTDVPDMRSGLDRLLCILENARDFDEQFQHLKDLDLDVLGAYYASRYEGYKLVTEAMHLIHLYFFISRGYELKEASLSIDTKFKPKKSALLDMDETFFNKYSGPLDPVTNKPIPGVFYCHETLLTSFFFRYLAPYNHRAAIESYQNAFNKLKQSVNTKDKNGKDSFSEKEKFDFYRIFLSIMAMAGTGLKGKIFSNDDVDNLIDNLQVFYERAKNSGSTLDALLKHFLKKIAEKEIKISLIDVNNLFYLLNALPENEIGQVVSVLTPVTAMVEDGMLDQGQFFAALSFLKKNSQAIKITTLVNAMSCSGYTKAVNESGNPKPVYSALLLILSLLNKNQLPEENIKETISPIAEKLAAFFEHKNRPDVQAFFLKLLTAIDPATTAELAFEHWNKVIDNLSECDNDTSEYDLLEKIKAAMPANCRMDLHGLSDSGTRKSTDFTRILAKHTQELINIAKPYKMILEKIDPTFFDTLQNPAAINDAIGNLIQVLGEVAENETVLDTAPTEEEIKGLQQTDDEIEDKNEIEDEDEDEERLRKLAGKGIVVFKLFAPKLKELMLKVYDEEIANALLTVKHQGVNTFMSTQFPHRLKDKKIAIVDFLTDYNSQLEIKKDLIKQLKVIKHAWPDDFEELMAILNSDEPTWRETLKQVKDEILVQILTALVQYGSQKQPFPFNILRLFIKNGASKTTEVLLEQRLPDLSDRGSMLDEKQLASRLKIAQYALRYEGLEVKEGVMSPDNIDAKFEDASGNAFDNMLDFMIAGAEQNKYYSSQQIESLAGIINKIQNKALLPDLFTLLNQCNCLEKIAELEKQQDEPLNLIFSILLQSWQKTTEMPNDISTLIDKLTASDKDDLPKLEKLHDLDQALSLAALETVLAQKNIAQRLNEADKEPFKGIEGKERGAFDNGNIIDLIEKMRDMNRGEPLPYRERIKLLKWYRYIDEIGSTRPICVNPFLTIAEKYEFKPVKDFSSDEVTALLGHYRERLKDNITDGEREKIYLEFIAIAREMMYRRGLEKKENGEGMEKAGHFATPAQILCILEGMRGGSKNFMGQVKTGEGKTLIVGLEAAFLLFRGFSPVHVATSDFTLAKDGFDANQAFFRAMGVEARTLNAQDTDSDAYNEDAPPIQYTTLSDAALYDAKMIAEKGNVFPTDKAALILDEADKSALDDKTNYRFSRYLDAVIDPDQNPYEWAYLCLIDFVDRMKQDKNGYTDDDYLATAKQELDRAAKGAEKEILSTLLKSPDANKRITQWLMAAAKSASLINQEGTTFRVMTIEHPRKEGVLISKACILDGGDPNIPAKYSEPALHEFLELRLRKRYETKIKASDAAKKIPDFLIEPESIYVVSSNSPQQIHRYKYTFFTTGTAGSDKERHELAAKHNCYISALPPNTPSQLKETPPILTNPKYLSDPKREEQDHINKVVNFIKKELQKSKGKKIDPILITCLDKAQGERIQQALENMLAKNPKLKRKLSSSEDIQSFYGSSKSKPNERVDEKNAVIKKAGNSGRITISNLLNRGSDIKPEKGKRLLAVKTFIETRPASDEGIARRLGQEFGRPARQGAEGAAVLIGKRSDFLIMPTYAENPKALKKLKAAKAIDLVTELDEFQNKSAETRRDKNRGFDLLKNFVSRKFNEHIIQPIIEDEKTNNKDWSELKNRLFIEMGEFYRQIDERWTSELSKMEDGLDRLMREIVAKWKEKSNELKESIKQATEKTGDLSTKMNELELDIKEMQAKLKERHPEYQYYVKRSEQLHTLSTDPTSMEALETETFCDYVALNPEAVQNAYPDYSDLKKQALSKNLERLYRSLNTSQAFKGKLKVKDKLQLCGNPIEKAGLTGDQIQQLVRALLLLTYDAYIHHNDVGYHALLREYYRVMGHITKYGNANLNKQIEQIHLNHYDAVSTHKTASSSMKDGYLREFNRLMTKRAAGKPAASAVHDQDQTAATAQENQTKIMKESANSFDTKKIAQWDQKKIQIITALQKYSKGSLLPRMPVSKDRKESCQKIIDALNSMDGTNSQFSVLLTSLKETRVTLFETDTQKGRKIETTLNGRLNRYIHRIRNRVFTYAAESELEKLLSLEFSDIHAVLTEFFKQKMNEQTLSQERITEPLAKIDNSEKSLEERYAAFEELFAKLKLAEHHGFSLAKKSPLLLHYMQSRLDLLDSAFKRLPPPQDDTQEQPSRVLNDAAIEATLSFMKWITSPRASFFHGKNGQSERKENQLSYRNYTLELQGLVGENAVKSNRVADNIDRLLDLVERNIVEKSGEASTRVRFQSVEFEQESNKTNSQDLKVIITLSINGKDATINMAFDSLAHFPSCRATYNNKKADDQKLETAEQVPGNDPPALV